MIERLVVPVDFSAESRRAIAAAVALARPTGTAVQLLSVVSPLRRDEVEAHLRSVAAETGAPVAVELVESAERDVADVLLGRLEMDDLGLWCVGTHARGPIGEALLGSLSEVLVRESRIPVMLVGPHVTDPPTGNLLAVALDGSPRSEAVLTAAEDVADSLGMKLLLVQVALPPSADFPADAVETGYLSRVAGMMRGGGAVDFDVLHGHDPAADLVSYAGAHTEITAFAVSSRALGGTARLLHGSTAFGLAHRAPVPVLTLHHD